MVGKNFLVIGICVVLLCGHTRSTQSVEPEGSYRAGEVAAAEYRMVFLRDCNSDRNHLSQFASSTLELIVQRVREEQDYAPGKPYKRLLRAAENELNARVKGATEKHEE